MKTRMFTIVAFTLVFTLSSLLVNAAEKQKVPITEEVLSAIHEEMLGPKDVFKGRDLLIGFSQRRLAGSEWYEQLLRVSRNQAKWMGADIIILDADGDIQKQIADLESLVVRGVDAMILNPHHTEAVLPGVRKVHEAGIPLVVVNSELSQEGKPFCFVSADVFDSGYKGGRELAKAASKRWGIDQPVKGLIVSAYPATEESDLRRWGMVCGYTDYMLDKYARTNLQIVDHRYGHWLPDITLPLVMDSLTAHPDLKVIMSVCDGTTHGVVGALKTMDKLGEVLVCTIDGRKDVLEWIKEGDKGIVADSFNDPRLMGKWAVYFAAYAAMGYEVPDRFDTPNPCVTPENVDDYYDPESRF